jgi:Helix-turn-helix
MPAYREVGVDDIEIVPLVLVSQAFPARPSSLPEVRDFVRRRLAHAPLADDDVRTLGERVADVLLDAAGADGAIQVSLRIFPTYAEVDVLFTQDEDGMHTGTGIGAGPAPAHRAAAPVSAPPAVAAAEPVGPRPAAARRAGARPNAVPFAAWLAGALRREGMTMEAAARRLNVSSKTVSRWVGGTTEPRLRDLARIGEVFGDPPLP